MILCAHSYGGMVISMAAAGASQVEHLVYICAYVPDSGQSVHRRPRRQAFAVGPEARRRADDGRMLERAAPCCTEAAIQHPTVGDASAAAAVQRRVRGAGTPGRKEVPLDLCRLRQRQGRSRPSCSATCSRPGRRKSSSSTRVTRPSCRSRRSLPRLCFRDASRSVAGKSAAASSRRSSGGASDPRS